MTDADDPLVSLQARLDATEDHFIQQAIVDELTLSLRAATRRVQDADAAHREACAALGKPEQVLAELDEEIERVTGQAAEWGGKLSSLRTEDRVEARVRFQAWNDELDKLKEKRDQAERDLQPYFDARNKAEADLEQAKGAELSLGYAMVTPYESRVAQGTRAYITLRQPRLGYVLLAGDQSHREWEPAVAQLEEWCLSSAFRTDHLVGNAEAMAAAMTAEMADASDVVAPAPSAQEVMAADAYKVQNELMPPSRIDDYRGARPPVPRTAPVRDYMEYRSPLRSPGAR